MKVTAAVIAYNESANIEDCLNTVLWADEIILIDSGSTDNTRAKAEKYTPWIYQVPFRDFSFQRNKALELTTTEWIFFLDADERVPDTLAAEIQRIVRHEPPRLAYAVKRQTYFFGKRLRFSGTQADYPVRLFPAAKVRYEQPVHEKVITKLPLVRLKEPLLHFTTPGMAAYHRKLNLYIPLEISTMAGLNRRVSFSSILWKPLLKFFYLYLWQLGFLDGLAGLKLSALSAYYDFLRYSRFYFTRHKRS